ncbi:MAG: protein mobD [Terracidiphilus sp.]
MNEPIVIVSGSKGGVGKSLTTMALLDYFSANHKYQKLVDADVHNPDVWRCYGRAAEGEVVNLDDVDGWIQLVNLCDAAPFKTIVVNTPAQSNIAVAKHASILLDSLRELARPLVTLWVINRQRDSLELLHDYMSHMDGRLVHVVCNGYFGDENKFELYKGSTIRETLKAQGGKSLFLPDLSDRVTDELYGKRTTLAEAAQQFKLGDRAELQRWRASIAAMFAEIGL